MSDIDTTYAVKWKKCKGIPGLWVVDLSPNPLEHALEWEVDNEWDGGWEYPV